jgi:predicted nucleic acid-binding protein
MLQLWRNSPVFTLDPGEAAAIRLAIVLKADVLLLDERKGRLVARELGLAVAGVLGELLHAKAAGTIAKVRPELIRLRTEAGFFIDAEIEPSFFRNAANRRALCR